MNGTEPIPPVEYWESLSGIELGVAGFFIFGGIALLYKIIKKSLGK